MTDRDIVQGNNETVPQLDEPGFVVPCLHRSIVRDLDEDPGRR